MADPENSSELIHSIFTKSVEQRISETKEKYYGKTIVPRHTLSRPFKQLYDDKMVKSTCTLASALNCARALGRNLPDNAEELVLNSIESSVFEQNDGFLNLSVSIDLLKSMGYQVTDEFGHPEQLVDHLVDGGVAMVIVNGHAVTYSGVDIENGDITLIKHDPSKTAPLEERVSFDDHCSGLYGSPDTAFQVKLVK